MKWEGTGKRALKWEVRGKEGKGRGGGGDSPGARGTLTEERLLKSVIETNKRAFFLLSCMICYVIINSDPYLSLIRPAELSEWPKNLYSTVFFAIWFCSCLDQFSFSFFKPLFMFLLDFPLEEIFLKNILYKIFNLLFNWKNLRWCIKKMRKN